MITIYKTDTFKDAAKYVTDVVKRVDKTNLSVMHTVLVPDRASMEAERALLSAVGGSFNAQVRTFRRLCADILPHTEYLSKAAGVMALSGIVADNVDKLTDVQADNIADTMREYITLGKARKLFIDNV